MLHLVLLWGTLGGISPAAYQFSESNRTGRPLGRAEKVQTPPRATALASRKGGYRVPSGQFPPWSRTAVGASRLTAAHGSGAAGDETDRCCK